MRKEIWKPWNNLNQNLPLMEKTLRNKVHRTFQNLLQNVLKFWNTNPVVGGWKINLDKLFDFRVELISGNIRKVLNWGINFAETSTNWGYKDDKSNNLKMWKEKLLIKCFCKVFAQQTHLLIRSNSFGDWMLCKSWP